jgi:hypothetical protein
LTKKQDISALITYHRGGGDYTSDDDELLGNHADFKKICENTQKISYVSAEQQDKIIVGLGLGLQYREICTFPNMPNLASIVSMAVTDAAFRSRAMSAMLLVASDKVTSLDVIVEAVKTNELDPQQANTIARIRQLQVTSVLNQARFEVINKIVTADDPFEAISIERAQEIILEAAKVKVGMV